MRSGRAGGDPSPATGRGGADWRRHALAILLLTTTGTALAHGDAADAVPDQPGWRAGVALALAHTDTRATLPSERLGGFLLRGDPGVDRRGVALEHAVAELGYRHSQRWGAHLALGKHGSERAHTESAALMAWHEQADGALRGGWQLALGRQRPALGPVFASAGHLDRLGLVPLAKRAAVLDDWIDDGAQLGWQGERGAGRWIADAGLWRGRVFPGAPGSRSAPALHLGWDAGDWRVDGHLARFHPRGRGALAVGADGGAGGGHSHAAPACGNPTVQVLCYTGAATLTGLSARWDNHDGPLSAQAALWQRRESGDLSSADGLAAYQGSTRGGWLDLIWRVQPRLEAALRLERLRARHDLVGPGASVLARASTLAAYQPARRNTITVGYEASAQWTLRLEAGRETVAGSAQRFVLARAIWRFDVSGQAGAP